MARHALVPHPDFPSVAIDSITVGVERPERNRLVIEYRVAGAVSLAVWPVDRGLAFADDLWRHSCFEAFVALPDGGYREINLSPSRQWATYAFDEYRLGMRRANDVFVENIVWHEPAGVLISTVTISDLPSNTPLALTAVIEAADASKSFWALAHPPGPPDFHRADGFVARLPY